MIKDKNLKIVFFGDVVGKPGRKGIAQVLPEIKSSFKPDVIIANVENMAHGKGVTDKTLTAISNIGVEVYTSGEHIYDKASTELSKELFSQYPTLLKPANFMPEVAGRGEVIFETEKGKVLVISLMGQVFMRSGVLSPWTMLPEILARYEKENIVGTILDFHAEATSEKVAMGRYFDGKVSAILGTHTHIPTADAIILNGGTAYVTDVGMNGPKDSVIGMSPDRSIERFLTGDWVPYEIAESDEVVINYVLIEIDINTLKAVNIKHINKTLNVDSGE